MTSDLWIAQRLVDLYAGGTGFDYYDPGKGPSGICWASQRSEDVTDIFLRGSATFWDWVKDLMLLPAPWEHDTLGLIQPGFALGMDRCWAAIKANTIGPWRLHGHSLGAARADILAGLMLEEGIAPLGLVLFGEPKPGFQKLADYIASVPRHSYRNGNPTGLRGHDLVTDYPILASPPRYVHPSKLIDVSAVPDLKVDLEYGIFRFHHLPLYVEALGKYEPATSPRP